MESGRIEPLGSSRTSGGTALPPATRVGQARPGIHLNKKREDYHLEVGIEGVALNPYRQ